MSHPLPERIIVSAKGSDNLNGAAVIVSFITTFKNDFNYIIFLNEKGKAVLDKSEYLPKFDKERAFFLMDYGDPRAIFIGIVQANVMKAENIAAAINAFDTFSQHVTYPKNHCENLQRALDLLKRNSFQPEDVAVNVRLIYK